MTELISVCSSVVKYEIQIDVEVFWKMCSSWIYSVLRNESVGTKNAWVLTVLVKWCS